MRYWLVALPLLLLQVPPAQAQVAVNIGINLPVYPQLTLVPGYPVYYAPDVPGNLFFYDGLYWVYEDDVWYYSSWYNGPWYAVAPEYVPEYLLRVPVRYYRRPPIYFSYWRVDAPPRWNDHWGPGWARQRHGWDQWDRQRVPPPAPLPNYQRKYPQSRYPQGVQQQNIIRGEEYRFQPRNPVFRGQVPTAPAAVQQPPWRRGEVPGAGSDPTPPTPPPERLTPRTLQDRGWPSPQAQPLPSQRGEVRGPDRPGPPATPVERAVPSPRVFERSAPQLQAEPTPSNRGDVRGGERPPEPRRFERPMPLPMPRAAPEPRPPEQRVAPAPVPQMPPAMQPPQMRPDFQQRQQQPPPPPPPRSEPPNPGQERVQGIRRLEDGMRGRN